MDKNTSDSAEGEIICQCFQVSDTTIKACISSGNLDSIEAITEACGAGGGCQSCHMLLQLFLDQHHKRSTPKKESSETEGGVKKRGFFSKLFAKY